MTNRTNKEIKVSVIIPAYNVEKYFERCLESIYNQTLKEIEIIIVDDGSTDKTGEIAQKYITDERTIYLKQKQSGTSAARNKGLMLAKAKYVSFIDSDDYIDNDFIEKLYNAAIKNDADITCASIVRKHSTYEKWRVQYDKPAVYIDKKEQIDAIKFPDQCYVWNKLYKKNFLTENGFQFEKGVYYEDIKAMGYLILRCSKLAVVPDINYYYMVNDRQSVVKGPKTQKKETDRYNNQKEVIKWVMEEGIKLPESEYLIKKKEITFFNIPILKIKEDLKRNKTLYLLFNVIPVWYF